LFINSYLHSRSYLLNLKELKLLVSCPTLNVSLPEHFRKSIRMSGNLSLHVKSPIRVRQTALYQGIFITESSSSSAISSLCYSPKQCNFRGYKHSGDAARGSPLPFFSVHASIRSCVAATSNWFAGYRLSKCWSCYDVIYSYTFSKSSPPSATYTAANVDFYQASSCRATRLEEIALQLKTCF